MNTKGSARRKWMGCLTPSSGRPGHRIVVKRGGGGGGSYLRLPYPFVRHYHHGKLYFPHRRSLVMELQSTRELLSSSLKKVQNLELESRKVPGLESRIHELERNHKNRWGWFGSGFMGGGAIDFPYVYDYMSSSMSSFPNEANSKLTCLEFGSITYYLLVSQGYIWKTYRYS